MQKHELSLGARLTKISSHRAKLGGKSGGSSTDGIIFLNGPINEESSLPIVQEMTEIGMEAPWNQPDRITLIVNSPGGDLSCANQIIDTMSQLPIPVMTYCSGIAMSAALMILMHGTKGLRVATEHSVLMSHQFSGNFGGGKYHEMIADRRWQEITHNSIVKRYVQATKKSAAYVSKHLLHPSDIFMTPEEGLKHGIIDEVISI